MKRILRFCFSVFLLNLLLDLQPTLAGPDSYTKDKILWEGYQPYIAVDYERNVVHIVYLNGDMSALEYRIGDLEGNFGQPEIVFPRKMVSPRIRLDKNGIPHIVAATNMWGGKEKIFYSNRIEGEWKSPFKVMDGETDGTLNTINPWLCLGSNNQAYISCQSAHKGISGAICRIDNINTEPVVVRIVLSNNLLSSTLYFKDNELWGIMGNPFMKARYRISQIDTETLAPIGEAYMLGFIGSGEQVGTSIDQFGEIHMAGTSFAREHVGKGNYTSLSRLKEGKKPLAYISSNGHECGSGIPVRDRGSEDRIYVFYFNGGKDPGEGNKHLIADCSANNQVRFLRIENDSIVQDNMPITDDPASHGRSARTPPAVAAHPNGGVIVVHEVCQEKEGFESIKKAPRILNMVIIGETTEQY